MIIILSPAKTFNRKVYPYLTRPTFEDEAYKLIKQLNKVSATDLMKQMHISMSLAKQTKQDYQQFGVIKTAAIHGYNGHQFKQLDVISLEQKGYQRQLQSIYILSGLYGLVKAYDGISPYRLEMKDKTITNLYHFWKPKLIKYIKDYFKDDMIYNLASEEYGQLIKDLEHVITIQFYILKDHQLTIHAMEAKKMRGLFTRYLIEHPDIDPKTIMIENYQYDENLSSNKLMIYVRQIS